MTTESAGMCARHLDKMAPIQTLWLPGEKKKHYLEEKKTRLSYRTFEAGHLLS